MGLAGTTIGDRSGLGALKGTQLLLLKACPELVGPWYGVNALVPRRGSGREMQHDERYLPAISI